MADQRSIVLITVDCLRADHCGFMGYKCPTTPFLDGLASESYVFPTAIVSGVPTYYSFPAILASRYPLALGREVLGLAVNEKNLASACKDGGYATAFFGAANPYLSRRFGYDFGFDTFRDFLDDEVAPVPGKDAPANPRPSSVNRVLQRVSHAIPGVGDIYDELYFQYCQRWAAGPAKSFDLLRRFPAADVIVDQARTWLTSIGDAPFFLWLHLMDPHSPYYPTEKGLSLLGENGVTPSRARYLNEYWNRFDIGNHRLRSRREEIITLYDAGIRWVDSQLARLVETLRRFNRWQDCILAFTADHGEGFLEHGESYHAPALWEELVHVPLVLRAPGHKGIASAAPFSLIHLAPTLLEAAGVQTPADFQGKSQWKHVLEGTEWSEPAISECIAGCTNPFRPESRTGGRLLSVRESRFKLVLNFSTHTEDLFDLKADPNEQMPLSKPEAKGERKHLMEKALRHLQVSAGRKHSTAYLATRLREIELKATSDATGSGNSEQSSPKLKAAV